MNAAGLSKVLHADLPLPSARMRRWLRIGLQQVLLLAAMGLFVDALHKPALVVDFWHNGATKPFSGKDCLQWGCDYYPSNALLFLWPLIALMLSRARRPYAQIVFLILSLASTTWVLLVPISARVQDIYIGCAEWCGAHCLASIALMIPVWRGRLAGTKSSAGGPGFPVLVRSLAVCASVQGSVQPPISIDVSAVGAGDHLS